MSQNYQPPPWVRIRGKPAVDRRLGRTARRIYCGHRKRDRNRETIIPRKMINMWGDRAQGRELSIKRKKGSQEHVTIAISLDTVPGIVRSRRKEKEKGKEGERRKGITQGRQMRN